MTQERQLIYAARVISMVFTPFYLPIVGLALLFVFSYFNTLPWSFMVEVLLLVYFFTILLPTFLIRTYRRYQGWSLLELGQQERRMVPYIISILCYFVCVYFMEYLRMPHFLASIVNAALLVDRLAGLRGTDAFVSSEPPAEDSPSFFGTTYIDSSGTRWQELNLQILSQHPAFLSISA